MHLAPEHENTLITRLAEFDSAVLALSGGLDSSFLLYALKQAGVRTLAVTGQSPTVPAQDMRDAQSVAEYLGIPHRFIDTGEMQNNGFVKNTPDRCFHCKDDLFARLTALARKESYAHVLDGTTKDDLSDHRPGLRAARAHGVMSPLAESGMTKQLIRKAAKHAGLPVWDKPASPCLSSRFSYGTPITSEGLGRVARAEDFLRTLGLRELRVRVSDNDARVEVPPSDMPTLLNHHAEVARSLKTIGFRFVSLDLEGFQSGRMNRGLSLQDSLDRQNSLDRQDRQGQS